MQGVRLQRGASAVSVLPLVTKNRQTLVNKPIGWRGRSRDYLSCVLWNFMPLFPLCFWRLVFEHDCPATSPDSENHFAAVNARGDQGMGFSHKKTTHHLSIYYQRRIYRNSEE